MEPTTWDLILMGIYALPAILVLLALILPINLNFDPKENPYENCPEN